MQDEPNDGAKFFGALRMSGLLTSHHRHLSEERARLHREADPDFAAWAKGCGVIEHTAETQIRVHDMACVLVERNQAPDRKAVYSVLAAADRIANAAMWLVVHMTYARKAYIDGRALVQDDFKHDPEGHTGGSLNMVPAYVGYLTINALTSVTRAWLMGQGHCVAAIDASNLIVDNMTPAHAARYAYTDTGLTRFVRDFYACTVTAEGRPESPLGSHVNAYTAGGLIEGGYLGFAELQYVHMPLPGERLVAFLSDGAFEEQRASDWAPRWWRASDTGLVAPIMIANGRRIDQRSTMAQTGGVEWFRDHLRLNGFDPIDFDGRDPAAFAWAIHEIEERLTACSHAASAGSGEYPVLLHYGIAETVKGFGFPGAGTNRAHNLPLSGNPAVDPAAADEFNAGAERLWIPEQELRQAVCQLNNHAASKRRRERENPIVQRRVKQPVLPEPAWQLPDTDRRLSPMVAIDEYFTAIVEANPGLRPRVGNPDEMRSNRLNRTLDMLRHRVTAPEAGIAESVDGAVITALNEEAVVCAALGNKGGINLVASYEAFAVKMLGAVRQELIFARHQRDAGIEVSWLGVPILLTSHTWENGKNEQSHQDPTLAEALLGEMSDVSRVVFPPDWNTALATLRAVYNSRGQIWATVMPKRPLPCMFSPDQAEQIVKNGAIRLKGTGSADEALIMTATGAYQLHEVITASERLTSKGVSHSVIYLYEPGRFRVGRDAREQSVLTDDYVFHALYPAHGRARIFVTHTRPEPLLGVVRPLDTGPPTTVALGYRNRGGTLDVKGMLFANGCTWAHIVAAAAKTVALPLSDLLTSDEISAVNGQRAPSGVLFEALI